MRSVLAMAAMLLTASMAMAQANTSKTPPPAQGAQAGALPRSSRPTSTPGKV